MYTTKGMIPAYIPIDAWYFSTIHFEPNEKKFIDINYQVAANFDDVEHSSSIYTRYGPRSFSYDFTPASSWKDGVIDDFRMTIHYDPSHYKIDPIQFP